MTPRKSSISAYNTVIKIIGIGGAGNNTEPDVITPLGEAASAYQYYQTQSIGGLYYDGDYKLVYFPFAFEATSGLNNSTSRFDALGNIIAWFGIDEAPEIEQVVGESLPLRQQAAAPQEQVDLAVSFRPVGP